MKHEYQYFNPHQMARFGVTLIEILSFVSVCFPVKLMYLCGIHQECRMSNEYDLFFEADDVSWRQCKKKQLKVKKRKEYSIAF